MEHRPKEIVLTGGPCSGKTSFIDFLKNNLPKHGFRPFFTSEAATMIISGGVPDIGKIQREDFPKYIEIEKIMLSLHLDLRKNFKNLTSLFPGEKTILIHDRGGIDCKAYMPDQYFNAILAEKRLTFHDVRDNYDAAIHLVTAANGAEAFYNTTNNPARRETPEEARIADEKTLRAWIGHPHLKIVDNSTGFDEKLERAFRVFLKAVGFPVSLEIERKFLVGTMPDFRLPEFNFAQKTFIEQVYIKFPWGEETRIRRHTQGISSTYYKTHKADVRPGVNEELEDFIEPLNFLSMISYKIPGTGTIFKDRWYFVYKNQYFEFDIFARPKGLYLLEIELIDENDRVELPPFLDIIKEVTGDPEYKNFEIAKRIN